MKFRPRSALWRVAVFVSLVAFACVAASAKDFKFQALLVWATNAEKSPDPKHKPVSDDVRRKLEDLPLKWKNYFEVHREEFVVSSGTSSRNGRRVKLSDDCDVQVANVDSKTFEVSLIGKGKPVLKRNQSIAKDELLVLGGNAPDKNGWLVVLKRIE